MPIRSFRRTFGIFIGRRLLRFQHSTLPFFRANAITIDAHRDVPHEQLRILTAYRTLRHEQILNQQICRFFMVTGRCVP